MALEAALNQTTLRRELRDLIEEQKAMAPVLAELRAAVAGDAAHLRRGATRWLALWGATVDGHCRNEEARLVVWLPGSPQLARLHAEHGELRQITEALRDDPARLADLVELLARHLEWECSALLPAVAVAMGVTMPPMTFAAGAD